MIKTSIGAIGHKVVMEQLKTIFRKNYPVRFFINKLPMHIIFPYESPPLYISIISITICKKFIESLKSGTTKLSAPNFFGWMQHFHKITYHTLGQINNIIKMFKLVPRVIFLKTILCFCTNGCEYTIFCFAFFINNAMNSSQCLSYNFDFHAVSIPQEPYTALMIMGQYCVIVMVTKSLDYPFSIAFVNHCFNQNQNIRFNCPINKSPSLPELFLAPCTFQVVTFIIQLGKTNRISITFIHISKSNFEVRIGTVQELAKLASIPK